MYGTDDAAEHPQGRYNIAINEVCASNKDSLTLQSGTSPDWIELFNTGTENVDLRGVGLSDGNYLASHYGCDAGDVTIIKNGKSFDGSEEEYNQFRLFWEWAMEADMKDPANYQRVCDTIDVNGYIDFIAFENYIINWDCLENPNNWRVWRENNSEGKWRFILFDTEQSCGHNAKTMPAIDCFEKMDRSKSKNSISSLFFCLFENDRFKQAFYNRYRDIVSDNFRQTEVSELIDRYDSTVKSVVYDTFRRFGVKNVYEEQVRTVRQFYSQRSANALQYLEQFYDSFRSAGTETTAPVLETTTESTYLTTTESTETQAVSSFLPNAGRKPMRSSSITQRASKRGSAAHSSIHLCRIDRGAPAVSGAHSERIVS